MGQSLQRARERVLDDLGSHYARGHLGPPTLEQRVADVLTASTEQEVRVAIWDLPALRDPLLHRVTRRLSHGRGGPCRRLYLLDARSTCIELDGQPRSWVIGRSRSCDVVVAEEDVSRRHAMVSVRGGLCSIRDLGSLHGVHVNERLVQTATLRPGDGIRLGGTLTGVVR